MTLDPESGAASEPIPAGQVGDLPDAGGGAAEAQAALATTAQDARTTTITAVLVSYDETPQQLRAAVDSLLAQTRAPRIGRGCYR